MAEIGNFDSLTVHNVSLIWAKDFIFGIFKTKDDYNNAPKRRSSRANSAKPENPP